MLETARSHLEGLLRTLGRWLGVDAGYAVRGSIWLNGRLLFGTALSFGLAVAFANILAPEDYGTYKYILSAVTLWGAILLAGANVAVTGAVARGAERTFLASIPLQAKWDVFGALGIAGTGAYYILNDNPAVGIPMLAAALLYPVASIFNTYGAYFAGKRDFRSQSFYESLTSAVYFATLITALLLGANAGLLAVLFFAANAAGHFIGFRRATREVDRSTPVDEGALAYAKQLTLVSIPASLMLQADNILVFHYLGSSELAVYAFAMLGPDKIAGFLKFLPALAFPKYAQRSSEELRASVPRRILQVSMIAAGIAALYAILAPLFFRIFFPQYLDAVPYSQLYALSLLAAGAAIPLSSLMAQQRIRRIAALQIGLPLAQIVITLGGVLLYGLWGAIIAKLVGDIVGLVLTTTLHQYQRPLPAT